MNTLTEPFIFLSMSNNSVPFRSGASVVILTETGTIQEYKPLVVGRSLIQEIGLCRAKIRQDMHLGFNYVGSNKCEVDLILNKDDHKCTDDPTNGGGGDNSQPPGRRRRRDTTMQRMSCSTYDTLLVPKTLKIAWTSKSIFPQFPNITPLPIFGNQESKYLVRCVISLSSGDDSFVVRIPMFVISEGPLNVDFSSDNYPCDNEKLEFPVCLE